MGPRCLSVLSLFSPTRRSSVLLLTLVFASLLLFYSRRFYSPEAPIQRWMCPWDTAAIHPDAFAPVDSLSEEGPHIAALVDVIEHTAQCFDWYPLQEPYKEHFGERGQRAVALRKWIELADHLPPSSRSRKRIEEAMERAAVSIFPYLENPPSGTKTPLKSLRANSHADQTTQSTHGRGGGGKGIVIPTGTKSLKWACHQISSLLSVHRTTLPIQIAHAGDEDLPPAHRAFVKSLFPQASVTFLDVLSVFSDETLSLATGGWAIKPFALLASSFSEVLLADADTVFVRRPEELFSDSSYQEKGALLFHDRLLWKDKFAGRREWWRAQITRPGPELKKSLVWTEDYSEEGDSGVVLVDKRRTDVWVGMMHAAWQNARDVREKITYRITYGDKETYWFGLELTESKYSFERSYAGIAGWLGTRDGPVETPGEGEVAKVCSFVIAHADERGRLLWYNGSLRRNKASGEDREYLVPTHWMINGTWEKGPRGGFSCMRDGVLAELTVEERVVLGKSVEGAERLDEAFRKWGGDG